MTRASPRPPLHSSPLVRQLADLASADSPAARQSFAEQLAGWLDVQDAITLSATLHPSVRQAAPAAEASAANADLRRELDALRDGLRAAIHGEGAPQSGRTRLKLPMLGAADTRDAADDFTPYQRYYAALQRDMDAQIAALRGSVRAALARSAPAGRPQLRQLALLDAALDKAFGVRERSLLAAVPLLLEKRFAQLRAAHRQALAGAADDPARWLEAGGWLARFRETMQQLLLAELDLRLQPVSGLIEAYCQDLMKTPA